MQIIGPEADSRLDWLALTRAFEAGHSFPKAEITDSFLYQGNATLLSRAAWIEGLGIAVKSATVFPDNPEKGKPLISGAVNLFGTDGDLAAVLDFKLVTKWKTAADSLLGALKLARPDSKTILIVGAGTVGHSLRQAYGDGFPEADFLIWNRNGDRAEEFAAQYEKTTAVPDLESSVRRADIVTSATMSTDPLIRGKWLQPGQHVDLIGAYRPDMREVDDDALTRSKIFVDSRETTLGHIGEVKIPIETGVISEADIRADFYQLNQFGRRDQDITLFKNGGGAHLDLMTCDYILKTVKNT